MLLAGQFRVAHQLAQLVGQLLDDHAEALELLKHADQVLAGEATDHLQVFTRGRKEGKNKKHCRVCLPVEADHKTKSKYDTYAKSTLCLGGTQLCLPLVLCPVYSVLMAEEPFRFSRIMVSLIKAEEEEEEGSPINDTDHTN